MDVCTYCELRGRPARVKSDVVKYFRHLLHLSRFHACGSNQDISGDVTERKMKDILSKHWLIFLKKGQ
jgi:hypothetical protein